MKITSFLAAVPLLFLGACTQTHTSVFDPLAHVDVDKLPHVEEALVAPPNLPVYDQVDKSGPVVIDVKLTVEEKKMKIS